MTESCCQNPADSHPPFADIGALILLWRQLTPEEAQRAAALLPVVSDILREEGYRAGVDLDAEATKRPSFRSTLRSVTVDVTARALMTPANETPMTQASQSALGYSVSGTYLVPGGGVFVKKSELARLGLRRQQIGVLEPYDLNACGYPGDPADGFRP